MNKFLPKTSNTPKGFTLVELLVVVSIIAILAVVGMTIFTGVQSRARNARRQSDIQAIAKALEANKTPGTTVYPAIAATWFAGGVVPTESAGTTPRYNLVYSVTAGAQVAKPTTWAATAGPTSLPAGVTAIEVADAVPSGGNITSFQVCAQLEAPVSIFCVPNSQ